MERKSVELLACPTCSLTVFRCSCLCAGFSHNLLYYFLFSALDATCKDLDCQASLRHDTFTRILALVPCFLTSPRVPLTTCAVQYGQKSNGRRTLEEIKSQNVQSSASVTGYAEAHNVL